MKRRALERHLRAAGCQLAREGASHSVSRNAAGAQATIPRHTELATPTYAICDQLEITRPAGR